MRRGPQPGLSQNWAQAQEALSLEIPAGRVLSRESGSTTPGWLSLWKLVRLLMEVRVLALPDAWTRGRGKIMAENWARGRLRQNTGDGFTGTQSRGRRRRAASQHLAVGSHLQKRSCLQAGWGPSLGRK